MHTQKVNFIDYLFVLVFLLLTFIFIYPFWQVLVTSFSPEYQVKSLDLMLFPKEIIFSNYAVVFASSSVLTAYINTIKRTIVGSVCTILVTFAGAYALSKRTLPYRKTIMALITFTMFFGGGLIPTYLLVSSLGLVGSFWALILPSLASAWNVILARNFLYMMPPDLEESARMDGAGVFSILTKIVMPLSMPIIAVLFLFSAVSHWNAWFDAMIYLRGDKQIVLQYLIQRILMKARIIQESGFFDDVATQSITSSEAITAATIVITIGPIILLYPFVQKYFVKGIMVGSIKG